MGGNDINNSNYVNLTNIFNLNSVYNADSFFSTSLFWESSKDGIPSDLNDFKCPKFKWHEEPLETSLGSAPGFGIGKI